MNSININIENYEEYALDYLENNLSQNQRSAFEQFLNGHPAIADELTDLLDYRVAPVALSYDEKDKLFKNNTTNGMGRKLLVALISLLLLVTATIIIFNNNDKDDITNTNRTPSYKTEVNTMEQGSVAFPKKQTGITTQELNELSNTNKNQDKTTTDNSTEIKTQKLSTQEKQVEKVDTKIELQRLTELPKKNEKTKKKNTPIAQANTITPVNSTPELNNNSLIDNRDDVATSQTNQQLDDIKMESSIGEDVSIAIESNADTTTNNIALSKTEGFEVRAIEPIAAASEAVVASEAHSNTDLEERVSKISIVVDESTSDDEEIVASADPQTKKRKFRFRNFLPEQFAGVSKEDIKRSLIPEAYSK